MNKTASTTDNIIRNDVETSCVEENVDQRALGELGHDRTVPVSERRKQEVVLERVIGYALPDQCLVLHLRGKDLPNVKTFASDADLVSEWSGSHPNTLFLVTIDPKLYLWVS